MQCMSKRDHLNKTQSKNFAKTSSIFKNPKNLSQNEWNGWYKREKRSYQMKNTRFGPKIKWGMWKGWVKSVWEREKRFFVERNEEKIALRLYIENTKLDGSRAIESCRALILDRFICRGAIESYQWQRNLDRSNSYWASIEQTESFSMDRESVEKLSRQIQESFDGSRLR